MNFIQAVREIMDGRKVKLRFMANGSYFYWNKEVGDIWVFDTLSGFKTPMRPVAAYFLEEYEIYCEPSPMDKAWEEWEGMMSKTGSMWSSEYNREQSKSLFKIGWGKAEKHFTKQ